MNYKREEFTQENVFTGISDWVEMWIWLEMCVSKKKEKKCVYLFIYIHTHKLIYMYVCVHTHTYIHMNGTVWRTFDTATCTCRPTRFLLFS